MPGGRRYYVEALGRGLAVLDCFLNRPGAHSLAELSRMTGLQLPTTLRLVRTLEEAGYVRQDQHTKRYRLSLKLLQLPESVPTMLEYAGVARPYLEDLAGAVGETTGMAVLDGSDVRYALRVSSTSVISANVPPGMVFPAHATAMGKVLLAGMEPSAVRDLAARRPFERFTSTTVWRIDDVLAELADVAAQGYAVSNEEWQVGLRSVAAPVRMGHGRVVAAVSVIVVRPGVSTGQLERELLPALRTAATSISAELGYSSG